MSRLALFIATCGYVGYVPLAPGTFGSALGLTLIWALRRFGSGPLEIAVIVLLLAVGTWSGTLAERRLGRVDPGHVIIDEVAGMLITLAFVPLTPTTAIVGFLVFRALDIVKPWPVRTAERLPGGAGIMADDALAAVYGNAVVRGIMAVAPGWFT
jgi:phosphatidylglycerophosphatase A